MENSWVVFVWFEIGTHRYDGDDFLTNEYIIYMHWPSTTWIASTKWKYQFLRLSNLNMCDSMYELNNTNIEWKLVYVTNMSEKTLFRSSKLECYKKKLKICYGTKWMIDNTLKSSVCFHFDWPLRSIWDFRVSIECVILLFNK